MDFSKDTDIDKLKAEILGQADSIKSRLRKPVAFTIAAMVLFVPLFLYAGTIAAFLAVIVLAIFLGPAISRQLVPLAAMMMVFTLANRLIDLNLVEKSVTPAAAAAQVDTATKAAVAAALAQERARLAFEKRETDLQARAAKVDAVAEEQRKILADWERRLNEYRANLETRRLEVARANLARTEPETEYQGNSGNAGASKPDYRWYQNGRKTIDSSMQRGVAGINGGGYFHADYIADCDGTGHPPVQMKTSRGSDWINAPEPIRTTVGQLLCKA